MEKQGSEVCVGSWSVLGCKSAFLALRMTLAKISSENLMNENLVSMHRQNLIIRCV